MSSRNRAILIGGVVGAALGATAAWAYTQAQAAKLSTADRPGQQLRLKAGARDYVKIGMSLLGLIRQIMGLLKA